ncbi:MAG TPA: isochorismatase family protein [Vulgatibacter sp.]|nr:isochorismatase family protein [Vulgatibacter sp.]
MRKALLVVGVQNDLCCPEGASAVPDGDRVAPRISAVGSAVDHAGDLVIAAREWLPPDTESFANGRLAPYCVAGTSGAAFHPGLQLSRRTRQVLRYVDPEENGHSAFLAVARDASPLEDLLRVADVEEVFLGGLPLENAIRATAMDALRRGFGVTVLQDCVAARDPQAGRDVLTSLRLAGARVTSSGEAILSLYKSGEARLD